MSPARVTTGESSCRAAIQRLVDGDGAAPPDPAGGWAAALAELEARVVVVVVRRPLLFVGKAAVLSARTTSSPAVSPLVISTQPAPTAPVVTSTLRAVSARALSTTCTVPVPVPGGVRAEAAGVAAICEPAARAASRRKL